jgi:hypothetical protein
MGVGYNPRIVTSGLVGCWDAINPRSYPGSGSTWNDLSGRNNNGTLYNSPSVSNFGMTFNGSTQYCITGALPFGGSSAFSITGWFYATGTYTSGAAWGIGAAGVLTCLSCFSNGVANDLSIDLYGTTTYNSGQTLALNTWTFAAWVFAGGTFSRANMTIWKNQNYVTGTGLTISRGTEASVPNITAASGATFGRVDPTENLYYAPVNIGNLSLYNRALTTTEVTQNFNSARWRFGI